MATKPISTPITADLPTNWQNSQIVAPSGTAVGLTQQHGYNYLMDKVNKAITALMAINNAFPPLATQDDITSAINALAGVAGGLATLNSSGQIPASQLPSMSSVSTATVTLSASGWSADSANGGYVQTVAVSGVTIPANATVIVDVSTGANAANGVASLQDWYKVDLAERASNTSIRFRAYTSAPESAVTVNVVIAV